MGKIRDGLATFLSGLGVVPPPDAGNTDNPPGNPPVQTGSYEFIQEPFFQGFGANTTDIPLIAPGYVDIGEYGVNIADVSGNTGGGVYNGNQTNANEEELLYFDTNTGIYYNLGE